MYLTDVLCPADIDNGQLPVTCTRTVYEDCSNFTCNQGYEMNPEVTSLECNGNGVWSNAKPVCIRK